jgi:hypothetical protein
MTLVQLIRYQRSSLSKLSDEPFISELCPDFNEEAERTRLGEKSTRFWWTQTTAKR